MNRPPFHTTYRGYDIEHNGDSFAVRLDGALVNRLGSHEAALDWIDGEKRKQRAAKAEA